MENKIGSIWKNGIYTSILMHQTEKSCQEILNEAAG